MTLSELRIPPLPRPSAAVPRILCLTSHDLDGPEYGAAMRCRNLFRLLGRFGQVRVVLVCDRKFWSDPLPPTSGGFELAGAIHLRPAPRSTLGEALRREFDSRFLRTHSLQIDARDRQWLQEQIEAHDLVWVHGVLVANGCDLWRWPKSVLDIDDVPSTFFRSLLAQARTPLEKLRWHRVIFLWRRRESRLAERFNIVCVCSERDRQALGGARNYFTVPNGFSVPKAPPLRRISSPPRLGFIGKFDYEPNRQGVMWFVQEVWPMILKEIPQAQLRLVGEHTERERWRGNNIQALGWLADSAQEMSSWSLSIVPVLTGGGTRIKIAEAFSRKCPVVATTLGAYGYDVADGRELFLADSPRAFAEKCLRILLDTTQASRLAECGWQKFNECLTWDKQTDNVGGIVSTILAAGR
jgi:glycosyltransferase involved in cell wall biosynthesis